MDSTNNDQLNLMATKFLWDENDPTRLSSKEVRESFGTWTDFMVSYGLKPQKDGDLQEALSISRALKRAESGRNLHDSSRSFHDTPRSP